MANFSVILFINGAFQAKYLFFCGLVMEGTIKSPRPIPLLFNEGVTFSHKKSKKKDSNGDCVPPRPPVKSAPPVSRLFKNRGKYSSGPQSVSFRSTRSGILHIVCRTMLHFEMRVTVSSTQCNAHICSFDHNSTIREVFFVEYFTF